MFNFFKRTRHANLEELLIEKSHWFYPFVNETNRVILGRAGSGKTYLAQELLRRDRNANRVTFLGDTVYAEYVKQGYYPFLSVPPERIASTPEALAHLIYALVHDKDFLGLKVRQEMATSAILSKSPFPFPDFPDTHLVIHEDMPSLLNSGCTHKKLPDTEQCLEDLITGGWAVNMKTTIITAHTHFGSCQFKEKLARFNVPILILSPRHLPSELRYFCPNAPCDRLYEEFNLVRTALRTHPSKGFTACVLIRDGECTVQVMPKLYLDNTNEAKALHTT